MEKRIIENNVIYEEKTADAWGLPIREVKICDGEVPNVQIEEYSNENDFEPKLISSKISEEALDRIKSLLKQSKYLFTDKELEESQCRVLDGYQNNYVFCSEGKTCIIEKDNLMLEYEDFDRDSVAGEIVYIINTIYSILNEYEIYSLDYDDEDE